MMKMILGLAILGMVAMPLGAAPCRDAKGKFIKCPTAAAASGITKDAKGKCHAAGGKFVACPK